MVRLDIKVTEFLVNRGAGFAEILGFLVKRKAIINIKNDDDFCFRWAVTRALHPVKKNGNIATKKLWKQSEKYNWDGLEFPLAVKDFGIFAKNNGIGVNVYGIEKFMETDDPENPPLPTEYVHSLTGPIGTEYDKGVDLFFHDNHYSVISNLSRLLSGQISKHNGKVEICPYCQNHFGDERIWGNHLEKCRNLDHQRTIYPNVKEEKTPEGIKYLVKPTMKFEKWGHMERVPFIIYADIECMIRDIPDEYCSGRNAGEGTRSRLKKLHDPISCAYIILAGPVINRDFKPVFRTLDMKDAEHDVMSEFIESLTEDCKNLLETYFRNPVPIVMDDSDMEDFIMSTHCRFCKNTVGEDGKGWWDRVWDHCHFSGRYRGVAHRCCNIKARIPNFIPVVFHNLEGYDEHLFLPKLAKNGERVGGIPLNELKFKSITKQIGLVGNMNNVPFNIRFIDSLNFMGSSLDKLAKDVPSDGFGLLEKYMGSDPIHKQKGIFPYEWIDRLEKLNETCKSTEGKIIFDVRV